MKLPKNHFIATEIDYKINTDAKKILAGNWCHNHSNLDTSEISNTEITQGIWEDVFIKEKDYNFIRDILNIYSEKLSTYLNKYNNEKFSVEFWKILILPWLSYYLPSQLYKWRIVNKVLKEKGEFSFFSLPDHEIASYPVDTANYYNLIDVDNEFNYFEFKKILKHLKSKENKIIFIEKLYKKKINNDKKNSFSKKLKIYFFDILDSIFQTISKNNSIYIEDTAFRKKDYLKMNLQLKQFPPIYQKLFNYNLENIVFKNFQINIEKRRSIPFDDKVQNSENVDFLHYINLSITKDLPICFLEGFSHLKKSAEKININPKIIFSCFRHFFSEKFKYWVALKTTNDKAKLILTFHGGGHHRKFNETFHYERMIANMTATWTKSQDDKEIQLPANKFLNFKKKRKEYKYLSYVELRSGLFPSKFGDRQYIPETNLKNIKHFESLLEKKIFENLIYLPFDNYNWGCVNSVKKIIKSNYIQEPISLMKYLHKSKIVLCTYPETPLYEGIITGPTILLYNFSTDLIHERFEKIFKEMVKYKIIFSNPEEASLHINDIWDNVDEWWNSKNVKNTINEFMQQTCMTSDNSIKIWSDFFKEQLKKNI